MFQTIRIAVLTISLILIATFFVTCATKVDEHRGDNIMASKTIEKVLKEHTEELMSIPGVVGTAQGLCDDKPCIKFMS